jgi:TrmH family RNA methyltransferase
MTPKFISSRDNPLLQRLRRQLRARQGPGYRAAGQVCGSRATTSAARHWRAACRCRWQVCHRVHAVRAGAAAGAGAAEIVVLPAALFAGLSTLESPAAIGWPAGPAGAGGCDPGCATVVLDRVQDAGNVGSILRSAASVRRAPGAGAEGHGGAVVAQGAARRHGRALRPALAKASRSTRSPRWPCRWWPRVRTPGGAAEAACRRPCAWVLGHEGQGVSPDLLARCALTVRIPQPGGEESLNVAAAAAICL